MVNFLKNIFKAQKKAANSTPNKNDETISKATGVRFETITGEKKNELINRFVEKIFQSQEILEYDDLVSTDLDPLLEDTARLIVRNQTSSTTILQMRLKLHYKRVNRLINQLEFLGVVGEHRGVAGREVNFKSESETLQHLKILTQFFENNKLEIELKLNEQKKQIEKEKIKKELIEKEKKQKIERIREKAISELIDEGIISNPISSDEKIKIESLNIAESTIHKVKTGCARCNSDKELSFVFTIPISELGKPSFHNIRTLCRKCISEML